MAENSKIEWTDNTFNGWYGCTKVSPACDHCYAEVSTPARVSRSQGNETWGPRAPRKRTSASNWKKPLKWNKEAKAEGVRKRVFCLSLGDVFDNHKSILQEWRDDLWALIRATPHLDWQLLTKRPQNIKKYLPEDWGDGYPNVWLGTTVENQEEANRRIPALLDAPAKLRFLSCEPLLEKIDINNISNSPYAHNALTGGIWEPTNSQANSPNELGPKIDWVIIGGESGHNARSCWREWMDDIVIQCSEASVSVFVKQLGARYADQVNGICGKLTKWDYETLPKGPYKRLQDPKGGDVTEFPHSLSVKEFPNGDTNE